MGAGFGPGTRIWAFAHVLSGAKIGADCNICDHDHDHDYVEFGVVIGARVSIKIQGAAVRG